MTVSPAPESGFLQRALSGLGIDKAVGWTIASRLWAVIAGPVSVLLIATRLTADEQGFYYTFASIVSMQVMFELGLGLVVLQFASHERAFLQWRKDGTLTGSETEKARLASLVQKTLQWYAVATALATVALLIGGSIFFAFKPTSVTGWRAPWIALAFLAGTTLFLTPFLSVLEGCGLVTEVARVRLAMVAASNLAGWTVLLAGGKLWASPAITGGAALVASAWILMSHRRFFSDLLRTPGGGISWREEVWPFQWRVAVSWISGYFIIHLFIPVLFSARGPAVAGRMGMSLSLASAAYTVCCSLLTPKVQLFGALIAKRDFAALDAVFFPTVWRMAGAMVLGAATLFGGTLFLRHINHPWSHRILEPVPFALLLGAMMVQLMFFAQAVYLRAHKQEPLLGVFVVSAIVTSASTFILGHRYGATGMMAGYFAATLVVSLGGGTWVFIKKRREWH